MLYLLLFKKIDIKIKTNFNKYFLEVANKHTSPKGRAYSILQIKDSSTFVNKSIQVPHVWLSTRVKMKEPSITLSYWR